MVAMLKSLVSNGHQVASSRTQEHQQQQSTVARWTSRTTNQSILNTNNANLLMGNDRRFSSLFNSLKEQFLANCEKQQKLRFITKISTTRDDLREEQTFFGPKRLFFLAQIP